LFSEFSLHPFLLKALAATKITQPTPVQSQAIPEILAGKDLLISAETGSGKTAAFLLPMLHRFVENPQPRAGVRGLILVPTRELASQVFKSAQSLSRYTKVTAGLVTGGENYRVQASDLRKNPEIIIATPGRLIEHLHKGGIKLVDIESLVLDEADRMLDMGFTDDVMEIVKFCNQERQTLLLSATLNHRGIMAVAGSILKEPSEIEVNAAKDNHANIEQQIILADEPKQKAKMVASLIEQEQPTKAVVFTNTKLQADQLGALLRYHKLDVVTLHGDMDQPARKEVTHRFRHGKTQVLVATDVAARGLDIKDVNLVINFDFPRNADDYVHRIGRTGRAGNKGLAISFVCSNEWNLKVSVERYLDMPLKRRKIDGIAVEYKGPKKLKSSGKIAGSKKKKPAKGKAKAPVKKKRRRHSHAPAVNKGE
jgi:superfamily II DNA/RNA helicase